VTGELNVSFAELDDVATRLRTAATGTADPGASVPAISTGVLGGAAASEIVAHLLRQSAHLCLALESAGEAIQSTRDSYDAVDQSASQHQRGVMAFE
jgi:type VII secretion effector (TIGR04197 family)